MSMPDMSEMLLVLAIPELHCMFIMPGPDLTLDIQVWQGLQNTWSVDWLSKSNQMFGIETLDRLNASLEKCRQLLMQLWKPRNELSCSISEIWLGDILFSSIMVWSMVKARLGSDLEILSTISLAISPRKVVLLTYYIVVAVSYSSSMSSSIWEWDEWQNLSHSFFSGHSMWRCPLPPQRWQVQLGLYGAILFTEVLFWILSSRVV